MRLTYDRINHVAYLYITYPIENGTAVRQEVTEADGLILDFDASGHLLGIEFLRPEAQLRADTLERADSKE